MFNCVKLLGWVQQARRLTAAFAKKPPAEFPALPEALSLSSQGIIQEGFTSTGLCLQTVLSRPWDPTTTVVQMHI